MLNWAQLLSFALFFATTLTTTSAIAGPHAVTFTLQSDSSSALGRAMMYRNQKEFGTNYVITFKVQVPAVGEPPLKDPSNHLFLNFVQPNGENAQVESDLSEATIEPDASQGADTFIVKGPWIYQQINSMSLALKELPSPLPASSIWEHEVTCESNGDCIQEFTLNSRAVPSAPGKSLPQVYCARKTSLRDPSAKNTNVNRKNYISDAAYLDDQIIKQMDAGERGAYLQECAYFTSFSKPSAQTNTNFGPIQDHALAQSDLRFVSYLANLERKKGQKDELNNFQSLAFNRFQFDQDLNPLKNITLSKEAIDAAAAMDQGTYPEQDMRMSIGYNGAYRATKQLLERFPEYRKNIKIFIHMLSLIPDPDRWFVIEGVRSIDWKPVSAQEFTSLIPSSWRELGTQVASYRKGNTIYINQGFLDTYTKDRSFENFENLLLFEALKIWIPPTGDYDFNLFGQRFSRALTIGNLDEFRTKDAQGRPGLTFMEFSEKLLSEISSSSNWPWNAANSLFGATVGADSTEVRLIAPYTLTEVDGKASDSIVMTFSRARPANLDGNTRIQFSDVRLFCKSLQARFPAKILIAAKGAKYLVQNSTSKWLGIQTLSNGQTTITLSHAETCNEDLSQAAKNFWIESALPFIAGEYAE